MVNVRVVQRIMCDQPRQFTTCTEWFKIIRWMQSSGHTIQETSAAYCKSVAWIHDWEMICDWLPESMIKSEAFSYLVLSVFSRLYKKGYTLSSVATPAPAPPVYPERVDASAYVKLMRAFVNQVRTTNEAAKHLGLDAKFVEECYQASNLPSEVLNQGLEFSELVALAKIKARGFSVSVTK